MNVIVYSKPNCSYCSKAKMLLQAKNIGFTEMVLNHDFTREFLLETFPSAKSFPVIVIDGFYIGGYEQLKEKIDLELNTTQKLLNEGTDNV